MRLIGLTGKARAGKDTTGKMIQSWAQWDGRSVEVHSFAAKLKVSAARALGCATETEEQCINFCEQLKQDGATVTAAFPVGPGYAAETEISIPGREYLQLYGTEAHRGVFGSEFWVYALLEPLDRRVRELTAPDIVVVTDARFENEAQAIKDRGGEVWEVVRPEHGDELTNALDTHVSEAGLPEELIDLTITNDGGLEDLRERVFGACEVRI